MLTLSDTSTDFDAVGKRRPPDCLPLEDSIEGEAAETGFTNVPLINLSDVSEAAVDVRQPTRPAARHVAKRLLPQP